MDQPDDLNTDALDDLLRRIALNLRTQMADRGVTQEKLAASTGLHGRTITNFTSPTSRRRKDGAATEDGTSRSAPSGTIANLIRIALALGVEPWELLCETDALAARRRFHMVVEEAFQVRLRATDGKADPQD